jgi:AcrR family transcriptional regulator
MPSNKKAKLLIIEPKTKKGLDTQEAILQATTHILLAEGVYALNTNYIAEKAGISIGSLYQYYKNKESILDHMIEKNVERRSEKIKAALDFQSTLLPMDEMVAKVVDAIFDTQKPEDFELEKKLLTYMALEKKGNPEFYLKKSDMLVKPLVKALLLIKNPKLMSRNIDAITFILNQAVRGVLIGLSVLPESAPEVPVVKKELIRMISGYLKN